MRMRTRGWIATVLSVVTVAAGLFVAGRVSAGAGAARDGGYRRGYSAGVAAGVAAGHADGLREGRAVQLTQSLPADQQRALQAAFTTGYAAGENDVFDGYDGGWGISTPYVVVLAPGSDGATYRISSRVELRPDINYYLCPDSTRLCQAPR
jgi:hypothetical protein